MNSKKCIDKLFDNSNIEIILNEILTYMNINPNYTQEKLLQIYSFQKILKHINSSQPEIIKENEILKAQIEEYKEYVNLLETHIKYMPGGDGYQDAKIEFEEKSKTYIKEN